MTPSNLGPFWLFVQPFVADLAQGDLADLLGPVKQVRWQWETHCPTPVQGGAVVTTTPAQAASDKEGVYDVPPLGRPYREVWAREDGWPGPLHGYPWPTTGRVWGCFLGG